MSRRQHVETGDTPDEPLSKHRCYRFDKKRRNFPSGRHLIQSRGWTERERETLVSFVASHHTAEGKKGWPTHHQHDFWLSCSKFVGSRSDNACRGEVLKLRSKFKTVASAEDHYNISYEEDNATGLTHQDLQKTLQNMQQSERLKVLEGLFSKTRTQRVVNMRMLTINTNVKEKDIPATFLQEASTSLQAMIGKPMQCIAVHVIPGQMMSFGGTTEPCALVSVQSIGKISPEENIVYSQKIKELMKKVGVSSNRMYIIFQDISRDNVGYTGTTFSGLAAKKSEST